MCGEQVWSTGDVVTATGSPPRVRGTGKTKEVTEMREGITPACAGNSRLGCLDAYSSWDHPRVCGEQALDVMHFSRMGGSPPRVRGTGQADRNRD